MNLQNSDDKTTMIFEKSIELFLKNGYNNTTLRMIQKETGLHSGSIYYVINGKTGILSMITEGFFGDILCRSSRIAREQSDDRLLLLLPPAFILYAASQSNCLSRLLSEIFCIESQRELITNMAAEWGLRYNKELKEPESKIMLDFFYGGLGSLIENESEISFKIKTLVSFSNNIVKDVDSDLKKLILKTVFDERLPFFGNEISKLDDSGVE